VNNEAAVFMENGAPRRQGLSLRNGQTMADRSVQARGSAESVTPGTSTLIRTTGTHREGLL
jgi:hypothetical protein